jgi:hypothetical protein
MTTQSNFDKLAVGHELVLQTDADILEVLSIQQLRDIIKINYTTEAEEFKCITTTEKIFSHNISNLAIQIYHTQKGVYRRHLIISNSLAKSLAFNASTDRDYITIDSNFKGSIITITDYQRVLISLNSWRYRQPILKKALMISPLVYETVNTFIKTFDMYFNLRYYKEIIINLAERLEKSHDTMSEDMLEDSLNYLKFYERRLSLLQVDKIHVCFLKILKNWVLCQHQFFNLQLLTQAIKILNQTQKFPHLDNNTGTSIISHYLKQI